MQVDQEETPPPNALLLLVSGDGIPLLVRSYGDVSTPPSAAVGVTSALYHAATRENNDVVELTLQKLETKHRSVVYEVTPTDLLLVFASDKTCEGCPSSGVMVRRMLRTVYDFVLLQIGLSNLRDWNVSKLRAAIAKQVEVVDTIVTKFQIDIRFVFGRPVRDVIAYRQLDGIDVERSDGLLQGAWLENGELVAEFFQKNGPKVLTDKELLLLTVLGECVGRRERNYSHYIGGAHFTRNQTGVKVVICNSSKGPLVTFIGIFEDKTQDDKELKELADKLILYRAKARVRVTDVQLQLPSTLICSYASRLGDTPSPSCRTLAYLNSSWESTLKTEVTRLKLPIDYKQISRNFWWRELCRFAAHRQYPTASSIPANYKQEDEALTFLQYVRGSIQIVALCIGPVPVTRIVALGDTLAQVLLSIQ
ncbi:hypothetical protein DVH05_011331 [Phytophthora capsici]|nr:hypothetical protein DVH05_011331 [Phytophthora capsici]